MMHGTETGFDLGILSPFFYGASSLWMIAEKVELLKPPESSVLNTLISTLPGIMIGVGAIFQAISLAQHRRDLTKHRSEKLQNERYIKELEFRMKQ